jgi:EAL domain-containing protein (putative c-di-GMP-specific phosphodiesterase class I)
MLLALGCDLAQGYLVSPPVTAAEVPQRLRSLNERLQTADTATQQLEALRAG